MVAGDLAFGGIWDIACIPSVGNLSQLTTGYDLGELGLLAVLTAQTVLSWALRPPAAASLRPVP